MMETNQNTFRDKETEEAPAPAIEKKEPKPRKQGRIKYVLEGSFLTRDRLIRQLPFLATLTLLGVAYIFNSNYADKMVIQISKNTKELQELRFNYISTKSKLMQSSRQSILVHRLEDRGIKESKVPPKKIIIEEEKK